MADEISKAGHNVARLLHATNGTVVTAGDSLADRYRAAGWSDADAPAPQVEAPSEKPEIKRPQRKPRN